MPHLNTVVGLIGTGSVEGAVSAGATAYSIPQIDEKLQEQGYSEEVRANVLLGLSAGLGGLAGDTASVVNNVNQTQNNYLNHKETQLLLKSMVQAQTSCPTNPTGEACQKALKTSNQLFELDKARYLKLISDCKSKSMSTCSNLQTYQDYQEAMYSFTGKPLSGAEQEIFGKLPSNIFDKNFKGYQPYKD